MKPLIAALALVVGLWSATAGLTRDAPTRTEQLRFAPGTAATTVSGSITGREYIAYTLAAEAGQRIGIVLSSANPSLSFNLYEPGRGPGKEALVIGEMLDRPNRFDGTLPSFGLYTITVFLYRNAARDGQRAAFTLDVAVTGDPGAVGQGDGADGLAGEGPDYWAVATSGSGTLRLRARPSTGAPEMARLARGAVLRNLGCRMAEGLQWCRVATLDAAQQGWAAARFLTEAAAPPAASADALVAGTAFHATGLVSCTPVAGAADTQCPFGVIRRGGGTGAVHLTLPDGTTRVLQFDAGVPVAVDPAPGETAPELSVARDGDTSIVTIGGQRFVIPNAVLLGG